MGGVIQTNPARCRDCYACVRACPVKAVRVRAAQAEVVQDLCLACGRCVRACPQNAKQVRNDRLIVRAALREGRPVIASVAPSAPALFDLTSFAPLQEVLSRLGFTAASETALGAEMTGRAHGQLLAAEDTVHPLIASACPVVVSLVEMYYPDLIPHLSPVVSPMIAHGRWLRARYGADACVVFIGPCLAKKAEIRDRAVAGVINAALTFGELEEWLDEADVAIERPEVEPELVEDRPPARLFAVEGGLVGTAQLNTDLLADRIIVTSGLEACREVLEGIRRGQLDARLAELMACEGGCINGPAMVQGQTSLYRQRLLAYAARRQPDPLPTEDEWPDLYRTYRDRSVRAPEFSEQEIRAALARLDKYTLEDELNCGACGYSSCREKVIAALRGMAELTMCIPYVRNRAESLTNVVMNSVPSALFVVDENLLVQDASAATQRMFGCRRSEVINRPIREFVPDVSQFSEVRRKGEPIIRKKQRLRPNLVVEMTIVPVEGKGQLLVILWDITEQEKDRAALAHLQAETLQRTQAVITKQMRVAHEIAGLLGETTAETKVLLTELLRLLEKDGDSGASG